MDERSAWDEWTKPANAFAVLAFAAAPVFAIALVAWLIARAT